MIHFDNRVGSKEFPSLPPLTTYDTDIFSFESLSIPGDVYFYGNGPQGIINIGIEIKSLHDLVTSLDTGRLQGQGTGSSHGQLLRMLDYFGMSNLIYYGNYEASDDDNPLVRYVTTNTKGLIRRIARRYANDHGRFIPWLDSILKTLHLGKRKCYWSGLHSALSRLQHHGVHVHHVVTKREVAILITSLYNLYQKPWSAHKLFRAFNTSNPTSTRIRVQRIPHKIKVAAKILTGIDQVGYETSLAIAHHFDGDVAMAFRSMASSPNAIAHIQVNGRRIGNVVSGAVYEIVKPCKLSVDDVVRKLEVK